jgi:two-component system chemotaxis sensor kinase CheA
MADAEPNVRQVFADDASARLDRMGEQLLELEHTPGKAGLLADLFREAHSLKGGAGVIGLDHVADVAHALEDPLQRLRSGQLQATATLTDALLATIDGLRSLVANPADGGDDGKQKATAEALVRRLVEGAVPEVAAASRVQDRPPDGPAATDGRTRESPAPPSSTMQVAVQRLDQIDRLVGEAAAAHLRVGQLLAEKLSVDPGTVPQYRDLARLLSRLQEVTMRARMVPLSTVTPGLHRAVRDLARVAGKQVRWEVDGGETEIDRNVLEILHDPLIHLVRNAVDHGIETPDKRLAAGKPTHGTIRLRGMQRGSEIVISISDDGNGIDVDGVRAAASRSGVETAHMSESQVIDLIFRPGVSTATQVTAVSGRGVGLDVVRTNLGFVRGRVEVRTVPKVGTEFIVAVPITLTIVQCLIVESGGQRLGLPLHSVVSLLPADAPQHRAGGRPMVLHGASAVPVASLAMTLGIGGGDHGPIVVVAGDHAEQAFRVDALMDQRDLVVKGLGRLLPRLEAVAGAGIQPDGTVVVVLDIPGLVKGAREEGTVTPPATAMAPHRASILVVDDALTVRELERSILERAGYTVRVAADGREALVLLSRAASDLVLTDLEMPSLDGLALTETIRKDPALGKMPVVILTSHDSEDDRKRGLAAGADAYIVKSGFDQQRLLSVVEQLLLGGRV